MRFGLGYPMYYGRLDWTYLLVLIGALLSIIASAKVKSTYASYARVAAANRLTGAGAARQILQAVGLYDVQITHIAGELTDHYDPRTRVLALSDSTYNSPSIAAIGVAAHECGHAIQHAEGYGPLNFRNALVPIANIGTKAGIPIILVGVILSYFQPLIQIGIAAFSLGTLFQLVTLPVEFNASGRALRILSDSGMLYQDELRGAKKVLSAAAMTYVAAAAASILSLLRLVLLFGGNRRRD